VQLPRGPGHRAGAGDGHQDPQPSDIQHRTNI
jgi:hypothetical protein